MDAEEPLKRIVDTAFSQISSLVREERDRARQSGLDQGRLEGRHEAEQESRAAVDAALAAARADDSASGLDGVLSALRALDQARSLTDVLGALVESAAQDAGRAAIFVVRGRALSSWRLKGFDSIDGDALDVPLQDGGVMTDAMRSKTAVTSRGGAQSGVPAFANTAGSVQALAFPLAIAGEAVAVLYADDGGKGERGAAPRSSWHGRIEIVARHATKCLEALTAVNAARSLAGSAQTPSHPSDTEPRSLSN